MKNFTPYEWKDEYGLDDPVLDEQHRALLDLANRLGTTCMAGHDDQVVADAFLALYEHVTSHFDEEEALFASLGSPSLEDHRREHEDLRRELKQLWVGTRLNVLREALPSVFRWVEQRLMPHMMASDRIARWGNLVRSEANPDPAELLPAAGTEAEGASQGCSHGIRPPSLP